MKPDEVAVLEPLLRKVVQSLNVLVRDTELALELLSSSRRHGSATHGPHGPVGDLVDDSRFAVRWNGRECPLGQTLLYRLFRRLALSLNRYVPNEQLLEEVWGGERSASAVRTAVRNLRRKLEAGGMADLAGVIDGRNPGHYGLRLDRLPPPGGPNRDPTQTRR